MAQLLSWKTVQSDLSVKLRGTNQQTSTGLLHLNSLISGGLSSDTSPFDSRRVQGYQLNYWRYLSNNASNGCAIGVRIPNWLWNAGLWVDGTTTFTDDTTDWQDTGANDFTFGTTSTNNDGFIVYSPVKFNLITINVGTAGSGTSQVAAGSYSKGDGTWANFPTKAFWQQDGAATFYGTGENIIFFKEPAQWGKTTGAEGTGIPSGVYAFRMRLTTAPTTSPGLGTAGEVWRMYMPRMDSTATPGTTGVGPLADGDKEELPGQLGAISMPYGDALGIYSAVVTNSNHGMASIQSGGAFSGGDS